MVVLILFAKEYTLLFFYYVSLSIFLLHLFLGPKDILIFVKILYISWKQTLTNSCILKSPFIIIR
jgi:hypothetical protein